MRFRRKGTVPTKPPEGDTGRGRVRRSSRLHRQRRAPLAAHTVESVVVRRSPQISATRADVISGATTRFEANGAQETVVGVANSYVAFTRVDLTGIKQITLAAQAPARENFLGGTIEVRLGSPTGVGRRPGRREERAASGRNGRGSARRGRPRPDDDDRGADPADAGARDVYLIFKNDNAKAGQPLISLSTRNVWEIGKRGRRP